MTGGGGEIERERDPSELVSLKEPPVPPHPPQPRSSEKAQMAGGIQYWGGAADPALLGGALIPPALLPMVWPGAVTPVPAPSGVG